MLVLKQRPRTRFTSPRLRGAVGLRSNPGEGDSQRARSAENPPHPDLLPARGERENSAISRGTMSRVVAASLATILISALPAKAEEPIALRDMGSFHVGGRLVEISGKPVKEV